ncbi:MAG: aspartyl protease family protein [Phycisphaerales bacterium]|nr:aspartyl protease family protein [Phycisphaerales bacterium]
MSGTAMILSFLLLLPAVDETKNPWKERVGPAIAAAEKSPSRRTIEAALDAAFRADDVAASGKAVALAGEHLKNTTEIRGKLLRAHWRAGRLGEVEKLLEGVTPTSRDLDALAVAVGAALSQCDFPRALKFADVIERIGPETALQANAMFSARLAGDQHKGVAAAVRKIEKLIDKENGYPDILLGESVDGLAKFFEQVGDEPLNQISKHGEAEMPLAAMLGVPRVDVMINGKGPYSFILDTGGSVILSISPAIAEECGIESIASASVRGVGGKMESGQAVADRVEIGSIELKRVMARVYKLPQGLDQMIDGIVGTGMFSKGRMTLDFSTGTLRVEPSSDKPGPGEEHPVRLIGDGKIVAPVKVEGEPVLAIVDSGAGANALSPSRLRAIFPDRDIQMMEVQAMGVGESATKLNLGPSAKLAGLGRELEHFSGVALDVLDALLSPALGIQTDALIGMPMLREMKTFTIDYHRARLWVQW